MEKGGKAMLAQRFFEGDTVQTARSLVGKYLVRRYGGLTLAARITETEAYVGRTDKACHAYGYRKTERTRTLFAPPGTAYVYLIYGMHCCLNFVTEPEGEPAAVLIRGLAPRHNQDIIAENRFHCKCADMSAYQKKNFLNGPGKVCAGMNIDRSLNALPWGSQELFVCQSLDELGLPTPEEDLAPLRIRVGKRIGIDYAQEAVDFPWRFYL
ncbi:MAG: DNA-3-methyladenine glycosylase [Oscillospiraceae bacterium]|nr:DNA-3-methyladenine glycosylase [Oscillospiraceae bacterium]